MHISAGWVMGCIELAETTKTLLIALNQNTKMLLGGYSKYLGHIQDAWFANAPTLQPTLILSRLNQGTSSFCHCTVYLHI